MTQAIDGYAEYRRDRADDATEVKGGETGDPGQLLPAKPKKQGKKEPWHCPTCGDPLAIKNNCRKAECLAKAVPV